MEFDATTLPDLDLPEFPPGLVWLVGAGPGAPGLLTLEGLHALQQADVIVHDALVPTAILDWARNDAKRISMGKRGGRTSPKQPEISALLVQHAQAGERVLRLKGGDPFVFGRGGEEAQALVKAGVPFRVTPGVTAGIGGLAAAGIPLTHRDVGNTVTFLTGHDQTGRTSTADWAALARSSDVIVMYMAMRNLGQIAANLIAGGRESDEPLAIISNATLPRMRVLETTLSRAADEARIQGFGSPAIIVLGQNVSLRQSLNWAADLAPTEGEAT